MTDLELHFKDTDLRETDELEAGCKSLPPYLEERFDQIDCGLRTLGGEIGKLAQAVEDIKGPPTAHVQQPSERSVADVDNRLFQQMGLVVEMVREAAERAPREVKAAAAAALGAEVQRLSETIDIRLQGLGNAVRAIEQSRIGMERHALEVRRRHDTGLAIRETWALFVLFGGGALSLINLVALAFLWFSRS